MKRSTARFLIGSALTIGGVVAYACFGGLTSSIHFYSGSWGYRDRDREHFVDFGRVPHADMVPRMSHEMARSGSIDYDARRGEYLAHVEHVKLVIARARNLEVAGRYAKSLEAFESVADTDALKSFVRDRREVLRGRSGRPAGSLAVYLRSRYILEFWPESSHDAAVRHLEAIKNDTALEANVAYALVGATASARRDLVNGYADVAARFPNHIRGQSAAIMVGINALSTGSKRPSSEVELQGKAALEQLLQEHPDTPFRYVALGWLGRWHYLQEDHESALEFYLQQIDASGDDAGRIKALASAAVVYERMGAASLHVESHLRQKVIAETAGLRFRFGPELHASFRKLSPDDIEALSKMLRTDAELLEAYLEFRIEETHLSRTAESDLREFASSAVRKLPNAGAGLLARIAQLNYNAGEYANAQEVARRVIRLSPHSLEGFRSRYVLASSLNKLGLADQGIAQYRKLLAHDLPDWLAHGTKEALAILHERQGDLVSAFQLYSELDYEQDMAFLADAKMTPHQLARARKSVPDGELHDILHFTLGMRYLRSDEYAKARREFLAVPAQTRAYGGLSKEEFDEIRVYAVELNEMTPIESVDDLASLDRAVRNARGSDAKAQALYDKAAYIYSHRNLLYYSPGLWRTNRSVLFDIYWSEDMNDGGDIAERDNHFDEHECLAHSMRICQKIIDKYPESEVRPQALYTGALSAWQVSDLNEVWRRRAAPLREQAVAWLDELAQEYPNHELAEDAAKYARAFKAEDHFRF
jgi:hypothetical protein